MEEPKIAELYPVKLPVKKGETYAWCSCGRSKNQPWCDGSHEGTSFKPLVFTADKDEDLNLCLCKHTSTPPLCDGTHLKLKGDKE